MRGIIYSNPVLLNRDLNKEGETLLSEAVKDAHLLLYPLDRIMKA